MDSGHTDASSVRVSVSVSVGPSVLLSCEQGNEYTKSVQTLHKNASLALVLIALLPSSLIHHKKWSLPSRNKSKYYDDEAMILISLKFIILIDFKTFYMLLNPKSLFFCAGFARGSILLAKLISI